MKKVKGWMAIGFAGILALGFFLIFPYTLFAQEKTIVWNIPHTAAPSYYHITHLKAFADVVKEKSKGRMEIRIHPASSLYPQNEQIPALIENRVEIAPVFSGYMTDTLLEMAVLDLPFMTGSLDEARAAAEKMRPFMIERLASKNLMLLSIGTWPTQQLYSTRKAFAKVSDWKGAKIRVYGSETAGFTKALGGAPVNIPFGEVYTALQKNTADGAISSATNAEIMKFFEVTKYINYWFIQGAAFEYLACNKKALNALPQDLQQVVLDSMKESRYQDRQWEDAKAWDAKAKKRCAELGMTVVDVAPEEIAKARTMSKASWDNWLKRTGPEGQRGMELALKALGR
jgi:TRAP-type C4-dicarboxylate transport system substrate-binding protein